MSRSFSSSGPLLPIHSQQVASARLAGRSGRCKRPPAVGSFRWRKKIASPFLSIQAPVNDAAAHFNCVPMNLTSLHFTALGHNLIYSFDGVKVKVLDP